MLINHTKEKTKNQNPFKKQPIDLTIPPPIGSPSLRHRVPLTIKMVALTIISGILIWITLDYYQSNKLRVMFHQQMTEKLDKYALENRLSFDRYVKSFQSSIKLITAMSGFRDYVNKQNWSDVDARSIQFHKRTPVWFPSRSILRTVVSPRYALLFDSRMQLREVYGSRGEQAPESLYEPTPLLIEKSRNQSFITNIAESPFLITSESIYNAAGQVLTTLMLVSPIDDDFLSASQGIFKEDRLVAFITAGQPPRILTSNNNKELPLGARLDILKNRYIITGGEFFDYGASELPLKQVSFVPLQEVESMAGAVISRARQERNMVSFALIVTFAFIMYWITLHIQKINRSIADFSGLVLGQKPRELSKGDQLQILKERFQDLTEEVISSREIIKRQADEKACLIASNSFDAIITADTKGVVEMWNEKAETIFGWSSEEAVGRIAADTIIPPQYYNSKSQSANSLSLELKDHNFMKQIETTAYHRDGHEFPVELSLSQTGPENSGGFVAVVRDLRDRRKAERDRQLFQGLMNRSNDAMMIMDSKKGRFLYVNDKACARLGYSRDELQCKNFNDIEADLSDEYSWLQYVERVKQSQNVIMEGHHKCKDGSLVPVELSVKMVKQDRANYLVAIARDITERKESEEQIKAALRENETLLREIHHRVKNNLQLICSFFNLQKRYIQDSSAYDMIMECQNRVKAIALVHEKLYQTEHFTNINIQEYISDLASSLVSFYEVSPDRVKVILDLEYIMLDINTAIPCGLIANELITNSLQYAFPNGVDGEISIKIYSQKDSLILSIGDNGAGLPEDNDAKTSDSMGLLIVNALIGQLGGTMEVDRNNGTNYTIIFGR